MNTILYKYNIIGSGEEDVNELPLHYHTIIFDDVYIIVYYLIGVCVCVCVCVCAVDTIIILL